MAPPFPNRGRPPKPNFTKPRSYSESNPAAARPPPQANGSALQKQGQWLTRAADAERVGDGVEAERCRQYAEHWFRVSRGQD
ncbi:DUF4167 domain-containing protein [Azospirillum cavernae]|uniref:DUF4167 domain-containing protein n=1 Tax=Azospirillum cavernae TaxID=2320860 RepID=A0A418W3I0_9PROT|nr:DUF4167 domain-containing protein [Azospirillum cavernae]RJF84557.1 DUF4167 domain-containing protein [Azospirillum cavernae]